MIDVVAVLKESAQRLRRDYGLKRVYFTRRFGRRAHFLAGCGETAFEPAGRMGLSENLEIHWQGALREEDRLEIRNKLEPITRSVEQVWNEESD